MQTQKQLTIDNSWQAIASLSDQMVGAAQEQKWPDVAAMATERHQAIEQHFDSYPVGPETATFYVSRLNQLLQQEEPLKQLAREARKQVMKDGGALVTGRKMQRAYQG